MLINNNDIILPENIIYTWDNFPIAVVLVLLFAFLNAGVNIPIAIMHPQLIRILVASRIDFGFIQMYLSHQEQATLVEDYGQFFSDNTLSQYISIFGIQPNNLMLTDLCLYYLELHNENLLGWDLTLQQITLFNNQIIQSNIF